MCHTNAHIPLRKNNPINPQPRQCAAMKDRDCLSHHLLDSNLLQQNGRQNASLHIVTNRNNPTIKVPYTKRAHNSLICSVCYYRMRQLIAHFLHAFFMVVNAEHLVAHFHQLKRQA
ncbi:hypothetical protein D3C76_1459570 [compost metagenome]